MYLTVLNIILQITSPTWIENVTVQYGQCNSVKHCTPTEQSADILVVILSTVHYLYRSSREQWWLTWLCIQYRVEYCTLLVVKGAVVVDMVVYAVYGI